jgi:hypothetical protein
MQDRFDAQVLPTCVGMVLNQVLVLLFENNQLKIA